MKVTCPHCAHSLTIPDVGRTRVRCPRCSNEFLAGPIVQQEGKHLLFLALDVVRNIPAIKEQLEKKS